MQHLRRRVKNWLSCSIFLIITAFLLSDTCVCNTLDLPLPFRILQSASFKTQRAAGKLKYAGIRILLQWKGRNTWPFNPLNTRAFFASIFKLSKIWVFNAISQQPSKNKTLELRYLDIISTSRHLKNVQMTDVAPFCRKFYKIFSHPKWPMVSYLLQLTFPRKRLSCQKLIKYKSKVNVTFSQSVFRLPASLSFIKFPV